MSIDPRKLIFAKEKSKSGDVMIWHFFSNITFEKKKKFTKNCGIQGQVSSLCFLQTVKTRKKNAKPMLVLIFLILFQKDVNI